MTDNKKSSIISKLNFSFGNSSVNNNSSSSTCVMEKDTFESTTVSEATSTISNSVDYSKFSTEKNMKHIANIINGLAMHEDIGSIQILEEIGTNSSIDTIREMTARALVRKNVAEALNIVITNEGKGINDLSTMVAMSTINELLSLQDKEVAMQILEETVANSEIESVRDNARSVKALMSLC